MIDTPFLMTKNECQRENKYQQAIRLPRLWSLTGTTSSTGSHCVQLSFFLGPSERRLTHNSEIGLTTRLLWHRISGYSYVTSLLGYTTGRADLGRVSGGCWTFICFTVGVNVLRRKGLKCYDDDDDICLFTLKDVCQLPYYCRTAEMNVYWVDIE